jgi:hypothetical protein
MIVRGCSPATSSRARRQVWRLCGVDPHSHMCTSLYATSLANLTGRPSREKPSPSAGSGSGMSVAICLGL